MSCDSSCVGPDPMPRVRCHRVTTNQSSKGNVDPILEMAAMPSLLVSQWMALLHEQNTAMRRTLWLLPQIA